MFSFIKEADALIRATKDDIMRINWRLPYDDAMQNVFWRRSRSLLR